MNLDTLTQLTTSSGELSYPSGAETRALQSRGNIFRLGPLSGAGRFENHLELHRGTTQLRQTRSTITLIRYHTTYNMRRDTVVRIVTAQREYESSRLTPNFRGSGVHIFEF